MRPILVRSELTGEVYVVTRYTINDKGFLTAHRKYDVTDDFTRIVKKLPPRALGSDVLGDREGKNG